MNITWQEVSLIMGVVTIITGGVVAIVKQDKSFKSGTETERLTPVSKGDIMNKCAQHEREIAVLKAEVTQRDRQSELERTALNKRLDQMDERMDRIENTLIKIQDQFNTLIGMVQQIKADGHARIQN